MFFSENEKRAFGRKIDRKNHGKLFLTGIWWKKEEKQSKITSSIYLLFENGKDVFMGVDNIDAIDFEMIKYKREKCSLHVTASELVPFLEQQKELGKKIGKYKMKFATENGYSTEKANDELVKLCLIPYDTIRKTIVGTTKCTRHFLYKFCLGVGMSLEEANEYFKMCDGPLYEKCMEDYIFIKALEQGDTVEKFAEEFLKHVGIKLVKKLRSMDE